MLASSYQICDCEEKESRNKKKNNNAEKSKNKNYRETKQSIIHRLPIMIR